MSRNFSPGDVVDAPWCDPAPGFETDLHNAMTNALGLAFNFSAPGHYLARSRDARIYSANCARAADAIKAAWREIERLRAIVDEANQ